MPGAGAGAGFGRSGSSPLLETLDAIAREAAVLIRQVYATKFSVDFKAPRDPVTEADRQANELICDRLRELFPDVPIVAEESEPETFAGYRTAERIFFVDPLDGTREFVARNGEFVVMIGYVEGERATASVIHAPESGVSWLGELGTGAYQTESDGSRKPISVSSVTTLARARIVGSRSHRNPALEQALAALGARELVALGSAGLKASVVANGAADAYVAPHYAGKRWDACASDALISAAGGKLTDSRGDRFDYRSEKLDNDRGIVASNGLFHDAIIEKLALTRG
ncbi:MAG TPA: 3'(2'),5'-bisphosphate nucleotidase CysQ [Polyangiaceae bacterium]|nr:3'(2'),5'-bisphosphate nucleotidase CysQ [Polyangiaceae bacterium]